VTVTVQRHAQPGSPPADAHRRILAVVFDMDGVLLDSEPLHHRVVNELLAEHGLRVDDALYRRYLGTTLEDTWADLIRRFGLPGSVANYRDRYDAAILEAYRRHAVPAPGALELVQGLRARGLKLGLASSSRTAWVETALARLGLAGAFDAVVTGEMVVRGKPAPEIYLLAAHRLSVPPERCLAIEDAPAGVAAARAAGMTVVAVRTPYTAGLPFDGATWVLDGLPAFEYAWIEGEGHEPTPP
jgi:HAD superfamily hydrolase (TIGR01509 family)